TSNATATADGGNGSLRSLFGATIARADATGTGGSSAANGLSAGGIIINLESHATAPVSGQSRAEARAGVTNQGRDAASATGLEAAAFSTGLPNDAEAHDFFAGNGSIKNHFNIATDDVAGATSDLFGLVTLGGSNSEGGSAASRVFTSSTTYAIDLAALTNPRQDLLVGLLDTHTEGTGFDSLNFQITREGAVVVNETFASLVSAVDYFDSKMLNLGSNGVLNVSGNLDLVFSLSLTTNDVGAGFYFDFVFGNSTIDSGRPPGDYDRDSDVDAADYDVWKASFGSLVDLAADGNGNSVVDAADYAIWRDHLGIGIGVELPGDYNRDGDVDAADYDVWKANFGSLVNLDADGNGDSIINAADYTVWRDNFGATPGSGSQTSSAVPEPSGGMLLAFAGVLLFGGRRLFGGQMAQPNRLKQAAAKRLR
ncbi:MAG: hypothetical protein L0Z07_00320, partial [Planctomycetes bacterium]|nr:hypothetical protein [Planctomycetota bacterium]